MQTQLHGKIQNSIGRDGEKKYFVTLQELYSNINFYS